MASFEQEDDEDYSRKDWIDEALAAGFGFKNDEERRAYLASLGDPLAHPLFAESAEACQEHPLSGAFRALNEEDKTATELAAMYKEEGNQWLKHGTVKDFREAYNCYTHALGHADRALAEAGSATGAEVGCDKTALMLLKSQVLGNRAQASLNLRNFGQCLLDCASSLDLQPSAKAHYRRARALIELRRYDEALLAVEDLLCLDKENKDAAALKSKCASELAKRSSAAASARRAQEQLETAWKTAWEISQSSGASLGHAASSSIDILPQMDYFSSLPRIEGDSVVWPIILLYPQYNQLDILQAVNPNDMLVEHLATIFPECGDGERTPWDRDDEYHVSGLTVYCPTNSSVRISSEEQWIISCKECADARGARGAEVAVKARAKCKKRNDSYQAQKDMQASATDVAEVHIGCRVVDILKAHNHIICGGLITLFVFPRGNAAHKKFLKESRVDKDFVILPNISTS